MTCPRGCVATPEMEDGTAHPFDMLSIWTISLLASNWRIHDHNEMDRAELLTACKRTLHEWLCPCNGNCGHC